MEDKEKEDLLIEIAVVEKLVKENPCRMKAGIFHALRDVVHSFIGKHCIEGATREQVAKYLERDVRTISYWREKYHDFPEPKKDFAHNKTYNWLDVIEWKIRHKELYNS